MTETCCSCKKVPEPFRPRRLYLEFHESIYTGVQRVYICEKCLERLPFSLHNELIKKSDSKDFCTLVIKALRNTNPQKRLNRDWCILFNNSHKVFEKFTSRHKFLKRFLDVKNVKKPIYGVYHDGRQLTNKEIDELMEKDLKKYKKEKDYIG